MELPQTIDVLCRVVDNYGDIGVALRLLRAIHDKAPSASLRLVVQGLNEVAFVLGGFDFFEIIDWKDFESVPKQSLIRQTDLVIETFGQGWPSHYDRVLACAHEKSPSLVINLEYLSNEDWVDEFHKIKGLIPHPFVKRFFFMPGLHQGTGGLMHLGRPLKKITEYSTSKPRLLLFFYQYTSDLFFADFFADRFEIYVTPGKTFESLALSHPNQGLPAHFVILPRLNQRDWDTCINSMDVIFVRGEESLAHALCTGIPFLWQTYQLANNEHEPKTRAIIAFVRKHAPDNEKMRNWETLMLDLNGIEPLTVDQKRSQLLAFMTFAISDEGRKVFLAAAETVAMAGDLIDNLFSFYQDMV